MKKTIGIIGCGDASKAAIEAILTAKDINGEVIIVDSNDLPETPKPPVFRLKAPPMGMTPEDIYRDYKDGRTLRRERRKRERLNKR